MSRKTRKTGSRAGTVDWVKVFRSSYDAEVKEWDEFWKSPFDNLLPCANAFYRKEKRTIACALTCGDDCVAVADSTERHKGHYQLRHNYKDCPGFKEPERKC